MRHVRAVVFACSIFVVTPLLGGSLAVASDGAMQDVRKMVEGVYTLQEWHAAQDVLRPPAVDGRFILADGVVMTILKNWSQSASKVSLSTYGSYVLDASGFSYHYNEGTVVTEAPTEAKVSHKLIFDGTRSFTVTRERDGLHFRRAEGAIDFLFTSDGLTYSENGKVLRVWRRVKGSRSS